ncbi:nuclear transport factor 2 family protein [Candidatus Dependentiae bacterium]|nr:nuclear transport factor 2 family protein [Candidatus Dependentiae bacterium]
MADLKIQKEIKKVLTEMFDAYSLKNIEKSIECVDEKFFMFGSGKDEIAKNLKDLKKGLTRDFSQVDELKCSIKFVHLENNSNTAWVSGYVTYIVRIKKEKNVYQYRYTCVLENKNKKWKLVLAHLSEPSSQQESGKSFAKVK